MKEVTSSPHFSEGRKSLRYMKDMRKLRNEKETVIYQ